MSKSIALRPQQWETLKTQLQKDYPLSVTTIRWKMQEVLGFVVREHTELSFNKNNNGRKYLESRKITMYLDCYNESKFTFFLLKYSDYLDNSGKNY
jgi:hypothetical protein